MSADDRRRSPRFPYRGPVLIVWDAEYCRTRYLRAKFLEISEGGARIEIPEPLAPNAQVSLRAQQFDLYGSVAVKHVVRCGSRYAVGLEFSPKLRSQAAAWLRTSHVTDDSTQGTGAIPAAKTVASEL